MQMCTHVIGAIFIIVGQVGSDSKNGSLAVIEGLSLIVCKLGKCSLGEVLSS